MKHTTIILAFTLLTTVLSAQNNIEKLKIKTMNDYEILKTESHISGLKITLTHQEPIVLSNDYAILFLHGSSFPSALSFGFKMNDHSWIDNMSDNGYDVYALDFLGYGNSDRYPEMETDLPAGKPVGRALDVYKDVDIAIDLILKRTGKKKVYLVGHSWGGSVAALYASKFPDKVSKLILFAAITKKETVSKAEEINYSFETMTPNERVHAMKNLTPEGKSCVLEPEVINIWGNTWLQSDPLTLKSKSGAIRFPSGPSQDVTDLLHNKPYYKPEDIKVPVLVIRGEWDSYPNNTDCEKLFSSLENAPYKKYVMLEKGTHVMHLEKSRYQLYDETLLFLKFGVNINEANNHPIAVIFEVIPTKDYKDDYLKIALTLKPELEKVNGFISIERFQSIYNPEKILSLSFWESEEAIQQWRNLEMHRNAQSKGRNYIFKEYQLRIAQVIRDYGMFDRKELPTDSKTYHN